MTTAPLYDTIGHGYQSHRLPDPSLEAAIHAALGTARTVVNVGAGAGSYEPNDRLVLPIEPSAVMAAQRPADRPALRGLAQDLPLHDRSVDAALAVLSLHHWHPDQRQGVLEMCRVARDTVVLVTVDPSVCGRMWLLADYLHEVREQDHTIFPSPEHIVSWFDRPARVEVLPIARTSPDHTLMSYWAHPERVFDASARQATSGFARQPKEVVARVLRELRHDLDTGLWDARHGHLRELDTFDAGLRLIVARQPA
jgi:SAM-dependent methyltransferase